MANSKRSSKAESSEAGAYKLHKFTHLSGESFLDVLHNCLDDFWKSEIQNSDHSSFAQPRSPADRTNKLIDEAHIIPSSLANRPAEDPQSERPKTGNYSS